MIELNRLIRHAIGPLVALLVAEGYIPESISGDITEFVVVGLGILIPIGFSYLRDRRNGVR